jgi:hypothetical protein
MLQLPERLRLDRPNTLARHRELLPNLFQRVIGIHPDAKPYAQHALFTRGERGAPSARTSG